MTMPSVGIVHRAGVLQAPPAQRVSSIALSAPSTQCAAM